MLCKRFSLVIRKTTLVGFAFNKDGAMLVFWVADIEGDCVLLTRPSCLFQLTYPAHLILTKATSIYTNIIQEGSIKYIKPQM